MQYLKYIYENENVRNLTSGYETGLTNIVNENIGFFILENFTYIVENLNQFIDYSNLETSYENIKSFICYDLVSLMSAISEVSSLDESLDHVEGIMEENVSSMFTGAGYGFQKAQRLISSTYVDDD